MSTVNTAVFLSAVNLSDPHLLLSMIYQTAITLINTSSYFTADGTVLNEWLLMLTTDMTYKEVEKWTLRALCSLTREGNEDGGFRMSMLILAVITVWQERLNWKRMMDGDRHDIMSLLRVVVGLTITYHQSEFESGSLPLSFVRMITIRYIDQGHDPLRHLLFTQCLVLYIEVADAQNDVLSALTFFKMAFAPHLMMVFERMLPGLQQSWDSADEEDWEGYREKLIGAIRSRSIMGMRVDDPESEVDAARESGSTANIFSVILRYSQTAFTVCFRHSEPNYALLIDPYNVYTANLHRPDPRSRLEVVCASVHIVKIVISNAPADRRTPESKRTRLIIAWASASDQGMYRVVLREDVEDVRIQLGRAWPGVTEDGRWCELAFRGEEEGMAFEDPVVSGVDDMMRLLEVV